MARRQRSPRGAYLRGDGLAPDSLGACGQPSDAKDLLRAHVKSLAFLSDPKSLAKFALISAGLAASMGLARMALLGHAWTVCWLASVAVAVWTQHAIAEEVHDGVHQHIFSRVPLNELASKLYASMIGISFRQFRKEHLAHHRFFVPLPIRTIPNTQRLRAGSRAGTRISCGTSRAMQWRSGCCGEQAEDRLMRVRLTQKGGLSIPPGPRSPSYRFWGLAVFWSLGPGILS